MPDMEANQTNEDGIENHHPRLLESIYNTQVRGDIHFACRVVNPNRLSGELQKMEYKGKEDDDARPDHSARCEATLEIAGLKIFDPITTSEVAEG